MSESKGLVGLASALVYGDRARDALNEFKEEGEAAAQLASKKEGEKISFVTTAFNLVEKDSERRLVNHA